MSEEPEDKEKLRRIRDTCVANIRERCIEEIHKRTTSIQDALYEAFRTSLVPVSVMVLLVVPATVGVFMFVVLFGAARGAGTLIRPTLLAHLYGRTQYASIAGVLQFSLSIAQAIAPVGAGAAYDRLHSYEPIFWGLTGLSTLAVLAVLPARRAIQSEP